MESLNHNQIPETDYSTCLLLNKSNSDQGLVIKIRFNNLQTKNPSIPDAEDRDRSTGHEEAAKSVSEGVSLKQQMEEMKSEENFTGDNKDILGDEMGDGESKKGPVSESSHLKVEKIKKPIQKEAPKSTIMNPFSHNSKDRMKNILENAANYNGQVLTFRKELHPLMAQAECEKTRKIPLESTNCIFPSYSIPCLISTQKGEMRYTGNKIPLVQKTSIENFITKNAANAHITLNADQGNRFHNSFQRKFQRRRRRTKAEMMGLV